MTFILAANSNSLLQASGKFCRRFSLCPDASKLMLFLALFLGYGLCPQFSQDKPDLKPEAPAPPAVQFLVGEDVVTARAIHQEQTEKHKYVLKGNAEINYRDMKFFANEITYDDDTGDVEATGVVRFERQVESITGSHLKMNILSKTGVIYDAKGKASPSFFFEGAEIYRIGEDKYKVIDGTITACKGEVPKWSFKAKSAIVNVDKNVFMHRATFKLKWVPILYSPFLAAPVTKRERQTGFLIPTTGTSTIKGRTLGDAFFWAINRSVDALFTAEYFSSRGWAQEVDFRARLSEANYINFFGFHVNDRQNQGGQSAKISANYLFGDGFRAVADVNYVSSLIFRQIFGESFNSIVLPDQTSQLFLSRNKDAVSLGSVVSRNETYFDQGPVTLRRFPSADFTLLPSQLKDLPIYFSLDAGADGIRRVEPGYATPNLTQRYDFAPRFTIPLKGFLGGFLTPSFELRDTFYSNRYLPMNQVQGSLNRLTGEFQLDFRGFGLERVYETKGGWFGDRIKHVIEPEVTYRYIGGVHDIDQIIRFDERDVLVNTNEVEYGVTNRFFTRRDSGTGEARELFSWKVSQKYYFDPTFGGAMVNGQRNVFEALQDLTGFAFADGPRRFSPIVSLLRVNPSDHLSGDFRFDYDTTIHQMRNASVTSDYRVPGGFLSFSYFLTRQHDPVTFSSNQLRTTFGIGNFNKPGVSAAFSFAYDLKRTVLQYSVAQVGYNWDCCGVTMEYREVNIGVRNETQFRFSFSLLNVGSFGTLKRQERLF